MRKRGIAPLVFLRRNAADAAPAGVRTALATRGRSGSGTAPEGAFLCYNSGPSVPIHPVRHAWSCSIPIST